MKRSATAIWQGTGKEGKGILTTQSQVLKDQPYSYVSRFEEGPGTNPEELVAAAHAACFAMKLSFVLSDAGFKPEELNVTATTELLGGKIAKSHLVLKAKVPGLTAEEFARHAADAKENCPISKSLTAEISLDATLEG